MKIFKRLFITLIAVLMVLTYAPAKVSAATALPEAVDGTITLTEDVTLTSTTSFYSDTVLDLNGYTLTYNVSSNGIAVYSSKTLTIKDSGENGKIVVNTTSTSNPTAIKVNSGCTLNMTGGTVEFGTVTTNWYGPNIYGVNNSGIVNISGGTISVNTAGTNYAISGGTVNVSGGTVIAGNENNTTKAPYALYNASSLTVTGGLVKVLDDDTYGWSDGHFAYGCSNVNITGGTFYSVKALDVSELENQLSSDYELQSVGENTYEVVEKATYVAQIGDAKYETLADAIAAVATDNTKTTIQMINDEAIANETITVATGKNIVLDLNGKTISGTSDQKSVYFISNAGTLEITDTSANKDGKITFQAVADTGYSVENVAVLNEGGTLTLTEGTVENTTAGGLTYAIKNSSNAWANSVISTFNMTGGSVTAPQGDGAIRVYQNTGIGWKVESKNYVNISGGTIVDTGMFIDTFLYTVNQDATDFNNDDLTKGCVIDTVINISGGTINGLIDLKVRHPYNTEINISGGDFTNCELRTRKVNSEYGKSLTAGEISEPTEPMFNITGGKFAFKSNGRIFVVNPDQTYSFTTDYKPYYVDGGVFNVDLNNYAGLSFAEGKEGIANVDADTKDAYPYTVGNAYVAQIGDVKYETLDAAVEEANDGNTIVILTDINLTSMVKIEKSVTIDGNNKTITFAKADSNNYAFFVVDEEEAQKQIEVNFKDLTVVSTGYQVAVMANGSYDSTVNLNNVDITTDGECIYSNGFFTVNATDCEFLHDGIYQTGKDAVYYSALIVGYHGTINATDCDVKSFGNGVSTFPSGGTVTLTNVDIEVVDSELGENAGYALWSRNEDYTSYPEYCTDSTINFVSGSVKGNYKITDKYPEGNSKNKYAAVINVSGGIFEVDPSEYVVDGYIVVANDDSTYLYKVVEDVTYVAQIGNVQYETLATAIEAAADNTLTTIVMIADEDIEGNAGVTVPSTKNIVLDLNGHTIQNLVNENKASQVITNKGTLTITDTSANGDGLIRNNVEEGTVAGNWYSTPQANYVTNVITNYGNLVINGGTLYQTSNGYIAFAVDNITNANLHTPVVTINGGTLKSEMTTVRLFCNSTTNLNSATMTGGNVESKRHAFYLQNANSKANKGSLEITDGTVSSTLNYLQIDAGTDSSQLDASITGGNFVGALSVDGTYKEFISGGKFAVEPNSDYIVEGYAALANTDEDSATYPYIVGEEVTYVAQIGDVQYETLAAAINAANQAENGVKTTIILINDEAFDYTTGGMTINAGKVVEIDLNGHQVVGTANSGTTSAFINNYGSLTILDSTDVDEDGVDCGRLAAGANPSWVWDGSDSYSGSYASNLINNLGTVVVKSGLLQNLSSGSAAYVVDNNSTNYDVSLTVTGGKLLATKSSVRQFANSKTHTNALTVTGGTIQGGRFGVVVHEYGQLTMNLSGGTITTTDTDNYAVNVWTTSSTDTQYANINVSGDVVIDGYLYLTDLGRKSSTGTPATVSISGGYIEGLIFYGNTDGLEGSVTGGHYVLNSVTDEEIAYPLSEQCIADGYEVAENKGADAEEYPYIVQEAVTYVAQIGDVQYETLVAAVANASADDTIVLIDDLTSDSYPYVDKDVTLDLNGHTAELTNQFGMVVSGSSLVITDNSANGDGKIVASGRYGIFVQLGGTLTVNGGTIETAYGKNGYAIYVHGGSANKDKVVVNAGNIVAGSGAYCIFGYNASEVEINGGAVTSASYGIAMFNTSTLTVNGGTITGNAYPIATNGNSGQNAQIIITGGTIGNENNEAGIYLPSGSLDVSGGTITGKTGIYFKSTNLNISGGEINGVGTAAEYNYNGNGSNSTGDALVIDSCGYPNGINDVAISGGNFNSTNAAAVKAYTYEDNVEVTEFITGGVFNTMPEEEYVAEGYKAVAYNEKYQVGPVSYEADTSDTIEGDVVPEEITYTINTIVKEDDSANAQEMDRTTDLSVTVSANATEDDTKAVASLANIKDDATLKAIVEKAVEAASSAIDANTNSATIEITVAKGDADVVSNKVTYEVHPEALVKVNGEEVASVKIENEDLNGTFTFKLYAGAIASVGDYVKVTHIHSDNTSEDLGELLVDADGYVTVTGVESFSDFTLEVVETESSDYAKFGYTISLEESINIIFNVKDLTDDLSTYKVVYTDPSTGEIVEKVPTSATLNSYTIAKCAAKQMGDVFTVLVKHNDEVINQTTDFSIKNYCDTIINGNYSDYIKDLCKATLDYGRYAQEEFDYYGSGLVNDGNDYFDNSAINVPDYAGQVESNTFGSELKVSFSLATESQTILNIYLTGSEANSYSVLVNGEETVFSSLGSDKIQVSITDIKAKDLGEKITIQVNDAGSMHELVYNVSPVDYMGFAVGHNSQVSINRAFYNYYLKAVDYFNNK